MSDRLTMVTDLGLLTQEAAQRGDDRAVAILRAVAGHLMEVHGDLLKLDERRRKDRQRPRSKSAESAESTESAESAEKAVFPPDPLFPKSTATATQHTAREAADYESRVELHIDLLSKAMGLELWPDADAFFKRRTYATWLGWIKEMEKMIGPGSQFTADDLAQVCRDDSTLERPIGSPLGLRKFLSSARGERMTPPPTNGTHRGGSTVAQRTLTNGLRAIGDL